jgi:hypothetical protein
MKRKNAGIPKFRYKQILLYKHIRVALCTCKSILFSTLWTESCHNLDILEHYPQLLQAQSCSVPQVHTHNAVRK